MLSAVKTMYPKTGKNKTRKMARFKIEDFQSSVLGATGLGEASAVAPFEYASLPFALVVGYYLWGDWPDWISFVGSGLIIFSGLLVFYLENRAHKKLRQHAQIDY